MTNSVGQEIKNYGQLLKHLSEDQIEELKNTILDFKTFGIKDYAERFIDAEGNSIKCL